MLNQVFSLFSFAVALQFFYNGMFSFWKIPSVEIILKTVSWNLNHSEVIIVHESFSKCNSRYLSVHTDTWCKPYMLLRNLLFPPLTVFWIKIFRILIGITFHYVYYQNLLTQPPIHRLLLLFCCSVASIKSQCLKQHPYNEHFALTWI